MDAEHAVAEASGGQVVVGHLRSLVPSQCPPHHLRQVVEEGTQCGLDSFGAVPVGQVVQPQGAAGPVDQGADRGAATTADDQITPPSPRPGRTRSRSKAPHRC
jgi:hypothetical protein